MRHFLILKSLIQTAASPAVWAGIGSSILCIGTSFWGLIGFTALTCLTIRNEISLQKMSAATPNSVGLIQYITLSPGANLIINALIWIVGAIECASKANVLFTFVFMLSAIGSLSAARVVNDKYRLLIHKHSSRQTPLVQIWQHLPINLRKVLTDPALWYCTANILLVLSQVESQILTHLSVKTLGILGGVIFSAIGLVQSISSAFQLSQAHSGIASYYNSLANLMFAISNLLSGNLQVGFANLAWGVSNALLGVKINCAHPMFFKDRQFLSSYAQ